MNKREFLSLSGAVPLVLAGCGSGDSGSAQIRLLNASVGYPDVDLLVDSNSVTDGAVAYGEMSEYVTVGSGSQATIIQDTSDATNKVTLLNTTRTLTEGGKYTVVLYGFAGSPKSVQMTENQTDPAAGYASVSVLNTSPDVGTVNVYFAPTSNITNVTATAQNVAGVAQTTYTPILPNTYTMVVTGSTSKDDVRLVVEGITFVDQQISTIVITPGESGVLARAIMFTKDSAEQPRVLDQARARVRLVCGIGDGTGAELSVNGVVAQTLDSSPGFFDTYKVVNSGVVPVVTVNGTSLPLVADYNVDGTTLKTGGDYTIIVYGDTAADAQAKLLKDYNTRPVNTGYVKARLVHLVNNRQNQLTLQFNFKSVASNVDYGNDYGSQQIPPDENATPYTEAPSGTTTVSLLQNGQEIYTRTDATLSSGSVYTAFAFQPAPDSATPTTPNTVILSDRT